MATIQPCNVSGVGKEFSQFPESLSTAMPRSCSVWWVVCLHRYQILNSERRELVFFEVLDAMRFEGPVENYRLTAKKLSHVPRQLSVAQQHAFRSVDLDTWRRQAWARANLHGQELPDVNEAMFVWSPIAHLIMLREWKTLAATRFAVQHVRGRQRPSMLWTSLPRPLAGRQLECAWDEQRLDAGTFDEIAFLLTRMVGSPILGEGDDILLAGIVSILFSLGVAFAPGAAHIQSASCKGPGRRTAYGTVVLLRCLGLAGLLRDAGNLKEVVERSLELLLPPRIVSVLREAFFVRGAHTISRSAQSLPRRDGRRADVVDARLQRQTPQRGRRDTSRRAELAER